MRLTTTGSNIKKVIVLSGIPTSGKTTDILGFIETIK